MMFAGFREVAGMTWYVYRYLLKGTVVFNSSINRSIVDSEAPFVADNYYQHLFKAGRDATSRCCTGATPCCQEATTANEM
jgi:hypothetical protein